MAAAFFQPDVPQTKDGQNTLMTLSSMTGFARADGRHAHYAWRWEVKSVNGKGLDVRCRLPNGMDGLESQLRRRIADKFRRGHFQVLLSVTRDMGDTELAINEQALRKVLELVRRLKQEEDLAPANLDGILALRGILELVEAEETAEDRVAREAAFLSGIDKALDGLTESRQSEGVRLEQVLVKAIDEIESLCQKAETNAAAQPDAIRQRLKDAVEELLQASPALPEERLAQEVAILMVKADIREEIDRLQAHTKAARELMKKSEPVGRSFDFLMQEFNREANTLCSKSTDVELTRIGLELKAVIDRVREQVQNIE